MIRSISPEIESTQEKLRLLEEHLEASRREAGGDQHVRELSQRSLQRLINQLKEEITRFKSQQETSGADGK